MLEVADAVKVAHAHNLPLILDAAAEEDLKKYLDLDVDIIILVVQNHLKDLLLHLSMGSKNILNGFDYKVLVSDGQ